VRAPGFATARCCCAALILGAGAASASDFAPTSQARSVDVTVTQHTLVCWPPPTGCTVQSTSSQSDPHSAPDFSPFSATAVVPPFTGSSASQDSSISASSITARGSVEDTGSASLTTPPNVYTEVESTAGSHFSTSFDVAEPTPYSLSGSVRASGGLSANSSAHVTLRTAGGQVLAEVSAATDPDCADPSCADVGPFPIARVGVLPAGSYVLEAAASGNAMPFFFAGSFLTLVSTAEFDARLDVRSVPSLGPGGLALLTASLAFASAAALRRHPASRRG
jgi:hypothetical protein